ELLIGNVYLAYRCYLVTRLRRVPDHADNRRTGRIRSRGELFAEWIPVREEPARQVLVDDRHAGSAGNVAIGKRAAGDQRNAHRGEILRADRARQRGLGLTDGAGEMHV